MPGKAFCPLTGAGYVSQKKGDYDRPIKAGLEAQELLVEVAGREHGRADPQGGGAARRVRARGDRRGPVGDTEDYPYKPYSTLQYPA